MSDTGSSSSGQTGGGRGKVEGKGGERIPSDGDCEHLGKKKRIMERRGSGKDNEERGIEREGGGVENKGWRERESSVPFHPPANILSTEPGRIFSSPMENTPGG